MFNRKQKNLVYLFIFLFPFFFFFTQPKNFTSFKTAIVSGLSQPIAFISFPFKELKKLLFYHRTFDEYIRLRKETDILKTRLTGMDDVILENARLEKLIEFKRKLVYSSVAANVVGRDPSYWNSTMILDKGEEDGLKIGQPVVNAQGVVGKIAEVGKNESKVILLTDPQFSTAAMIQRSRESGLVSGTLTGLCRMRYIDEKATIRVGDKVITSKLSSSFPESLIIGEIVEIQQSPNNPSPQCVIRPAVSFSQIEEVLVILN